MTRFEKWSVWVTTLLIGGTGIAYGWAKYLASSGDPYSVVNHPLQPALLKTHILTAPLWLFAIGMVAVRHIWGHFRSGTRLGRRSGVTAAFSLAPMVATGYLIQVLTGEGWLAAMAISHIGLGLLYLVGFGLHQAMVSRSLRRSRGGERGPGNGRGRADRGARRSVAAARRGKGAETEREGTADGGAKGMRRPRRATKGALLGLWLLIGAAAGCDRAPETDPGTDPEPAPEATETAEAARTFAGTPSGGLEAWIADIRSGMEGLPARVRERPDSARGRVLDLYLSRQEYIERYYGAGGPRSGGPALTGAVDAAEEAFHALMRATDADPPDSAAVAAAMEELGSWLDAVLREARAAGVPLDPPTAESSPDGSDGEDDPAPPSGEAPPVEEPGEGEAAGEANPGLPERLAAIEAGLDRLVRLGTGRTAEARRLATRLYLDHYEAIETLYGPGAPHGRSELSERVTAGERAFHDLMRAAEGEALARAAAELRERLAALEDAALEAGVPLRPRLPALAGDPEATAPGEATGAPLEPRSPEVAAIARELEAAEAAWETGDSAEALARVEGAYLEGFETLEPRLPAELVHRVERLFHLELRPLLARGAEPERVTAGFASLRGELAAVDRALEAGSSFWFGAFNAFAIILREGLEAVLLIGAILAYLSKVSGEERHRRQVWAGVGLGVAASVGTWVVARLLIPVGGASRELIEGVTALLAVAVLVYVSHWLFHKTYVHEWKDYLTERVGTAVSAGSAFAMAALAFAAVYREGFETVLFYQALLFDVGPGPLLAGFLPGLLLIVGVGVGIIRLGLRLPIRKVFAATNAILLYLAFVFLGKGLYNLQEAGLFAPHPVSWVPDGELLRQILGVYPVAETVAAQAAFLVTVGGSYLYYRWRGSRRRRSAASRPAGESPSRARVPSAGSAGTLSTEGRR